MLKRILAIMLIFTMLLSIPVYCADFEKGQKISSKGNPEADTPLATQYLVITNTEKRYSFAIKKGDTFEIFEAGTYSTKGEYDIVQ